MFIYEFVYEGSHETKSVLLTNKVRLTEWQYQNILNILRYKLLKEDNLNYDAMIYSLINEGFSVVVTGYCKEEN